MGEAWIEEKSPFIIASGILGLLMLIFLYLPIINTVISSPDRMISALMRSETRDAIFMSFYAALLAT